MKVLVSCLRTEFSLLGVDLESGEVFWRCPRSTLKTCGISYFGDSFVVASDPLVTAISRKGVKRLGLKGPYQPLLHSVHPIDREHFGVVDTGHSCLRILKRDLSSERAISPVASWPQVPPDAIHLNDFVLTPFGIYASCFDYRPWRTMQEHQSFEEWCTGGYGLILNITGNRGKGVGRVVKCGLNHPHSLQIHGECLFCCSSSSGEIHKLQFEQDGTLNESKRVCLGEKHFIRGLLPVDGYMVAGGSCARHGQKLTDKMSLYKIDSDFTKFEELRLSFDGEIYDIIPWDEELLPVVEKYVSELSDSSLR